MIPAYGRVNDHVVTSTEPEARHVVLVHGAANAAGVWLFWQRELAARGWTSHAVDLRGHGLAPGDLSRATMQDYAEDVGIVISALNDPPVVMGWSMGGLVAIMVAAGGGAAACVALAPSAPARTRDADAPLRHGIFGPEEFGITGRDLADQPAMPDLDREERDVALQAVANESRLARDERKAGIVVESLPCPLLIVTGTEDREWPRKAYEGLGLDARHVEVESASHWGLVLSRRALSKAVPRVTAWLDEVR